MNRFENYTGWAPAPLRSENEHEYEVIFRDIRPALLEWVRNTFTPRDIWEDTDPGVLFHDDELEEWALEHGFVRANKGAP